MSTTPSALVTAIRSKHPGVYDDLPDQELESRVLQKYPQYQDMAKSPTMPVSQQPINAGNMQPTDKPTSVWGAMTQPVLPQPKIYKQAASDFAGWTGKHLPQSIAPSVAAAGSVPLNIMDTLVNLGRNTALSPVGAMTMPMTGLASKLASIPFSAQGAKSAITPRQPGENTPDMLERRLMGGGMAVGGAGALGEGAKGDIQKTSKEIMGIGPSMANLKTWLHKSATEKIQPLVAKTAETARIDSVNKVMKAQQAVDAAHPEGVFDKGDLHSQTREAVKEIIKNPDAKISAPIAKFLDEAKPSKSSARALTSSEAQSAMVVKRSILDKGGTPEDARSVLQNQGFAPRQIDAMMSTMGTSAGTPKNLTFAQLWQRTQELGADPIRRANQGVAGAAANKVYGLWSQALRNAAEKEGQLHSWTTGKEGYQNYIADFKNGPLSKTLEGTNATDITEPFLGKTSEEVKNTLAKYDPEMLPSLLQEVDKHTLGGKQAERWNKPSKIDLIIGAVSPKAALMRLAIPYAMRQPRMIEAITGQGLKNLPPNRVAPAPPEK